MAQHQTNVKLTLSFLSKKLSSVKFINGNVNRVPFAQRGGEFSKKKTKS